MDIDEVVQKKEDNLDVFWKVTNGNSMWHSPLSPLSAVVTIIIYGISFSVEL